jgi:hypothetical protein
MPLGPLGVKEARVKYGAVLISFALARKAYQQITHVDAFIEAVLAGERARGRFDMLAGGRGRKEHNVASTLRMYDACYGTGAGSCFDLTSCASPTTKTPPTGSHTIHHFDPSVYHRRHNSLYRLIHLARRTLFARVPRPPPPHPQPPTLR